MINIINQKGTLGEFYTVRNKKYLSSHYRFMDTYKCKFCGQAFKMPRQTLDRDLSDVEYVLLRDHIILFHSF